MTTRTILTRDSIVKAKDYTIEEVEVPEWGGVVRLRSLTGKDRDEYESAIVDSSSSPGKPDARVDIRGLKALLLSMAIVDENDEKMFDKKEVDILNSKSAKVIEMLWNKAQEMNGIGIEAVDKAEKNLQGDRNDKPGSGSQESSEEEQSPNGKR